MGDDRRSGVSNDPIAYDPEIEASVEAALRGLFLNPWVAARISSAPEGVEGMSLSDLEEVILDRVAELRVLVRHREQRRNPQITLNMLLPSGRSFPHAVRLRSRIDKVCWELTCSEELRAFQDNCVKLLLGTLELEWHRAIGDYEVADGDSVTVVLTSRAADADPFEG
ncbi:unnamed protein product [Symbiodinium natans]|uniref:Ubiquitin-like domain-containing protein n=1 Tax=Symbiodinium natans TaxID=878477 RepID=A0A812JT95_9DINO|nr:unnamed protein product [Symbiodinium natans]